MIHYFLKLYKAVTSPIQESSAFNLADKVAYGANFNEKLKSLDFSELDLYNCTKNIITLKINRLKVSHKSFSDNPSSVYEFFEEIDPPNLQTKIQELSQLLNIKLRINVQKAEYNPNSSYTEVEIKISDIIIKELESEDFVKAFTKGATEGFTLSLNLPKDIVTHMSRHLGPVDGARLSHVNKLCNRQAKAKLLEYDQSVINR